MSDVITTPPAANQAACGACGSLALVQWQRRPTADELAALIAAEDSRRAHVLGMADPKQSTPAIRPAPAAADMVIAVFACADHAIHVDQASLVHSAECQAPHPDHLRGCNCEPEPQPAPVELGGSKTTLPTGWTVPHPS